MLLGTLDLEGRPSETALLSNERSSIKRIYEAIFGLGRRARSNDDFVTSWVGSLTTGYYGRGEGEAGGSAISPLFDHQALRLPSGDNIEHVIR